MGGGLQDAARAGRRATGIGSRGRSRRPMMPKAPRSVNAAAGATTGPPAAAFQSVVQWRLRTISSRARSRTSGAAMNPQARDHPPHDAALPAEPRQPRHPDLHRDDAARVLPDPARARRPDRDHGRRARHRRRAARGAAQGIRARPAGARPVRHLHRPRAARRPRQVDDHAGAGAARVRRAVSGDHRARALRDPVRARPRHSRRHARRGAPQLGVRPRRDGRVAHRLFDADLLVGAAADPAVLGAARLDAGVRPHRGQVLHRAGDRLPDDRRAARPARRARSSRRCRT